MIAELIKNPANVRPEIKQGRSSSENGGPIRHSDMESIRKLVIIVTRCASHLGKAQANINVPSTYAKASVE